MGRRGLEVLAAVAAGVALAVVGVVPVTSQVPTLEARRAEQPVPADDPWDGVWDAAQQRPIRLSAQQIAAPFGGTVTSLTARALHDGEAVHVMLEWRDGDADASVAGNQDFTDGIALQFPVSAGAAPPYTMGGPGEPVNIWHWKAAWQADMAGVTAAPEPAADFYPDPTYRPAARLGNPLATTDHPTPIENLVAEGFGSLTTADVQDVAGAGEWRDGVWRVSFSRGFDAAAPGLARFAVGDEQLVAFAVWDGAVDERNGQKAIAQFINLALTDTPARVDVMELAGDDRVGSPWPFVGALAVGMLVAVSAAGWATRRRGEE